MAAGIQAIDKKSVHRICSGQVVLNLATAVKELVENSIDAGASIIEVRLREYGSDLVEVVDNGLGVEESNFEGLTLKHHTSKLQDFADLVSVETFGFRGEALSSLCALSKLTITTCHVDGKVGTKLEYDHNGKLINQTPCARQQGTTVCLSQLFSTLPVRHKEFQRNLKKEFSKMVQVLNSYCIVATGVRISCTNVTEKGKKSTVISTNGNPGMRENITNVFGAKQLNTLMDFTQCQPEDDTAEEYGLKSTNKNGLLKITGFISKCDHGLGRSSTDRQFFFINKRPCDLTKLSKVINEVYHMYNRHQYPFVALNMSLEKESVDVNVTPDKRQVFLENEKLLLATVKSSLMKMFEPRGRMYTMTNPVLSSFPTILTSPVSTLTSPVSTLTSSVSTLTSPVSALTSSVSTLTSPVSAFTSPTSAKPDQNEKKPVPSTLAKLKRCFSSAFAKDVQQADGSPVSKQRCLDSFVSLHSFKSKTSSEKILNQSGNGLHLKSSPDSAFASQETYASQISDGADSESISDIHILEDSVSQGPPFNQSWNRVTEDDDSPLNVVDSDSLTTYGQHNDRDSCANDVYLGFTNKTLESSSNSKSDFHLESRTKSLIFHAEELSDKQMAEDSASNLGGKCVISDSDISSKHLPSAIREVFSSNNTVKDGGNSESVKEADSRHKFDETVAEGENLNNIQVIQKEVDQFESVKRKEHAIPFSMSDLKEMLQKRRELSKEESGEVCRKFRATISPADNTTAEEELKKEIRMDMFPEMEVLGQFNLGFIIGKLGPDLFIIDQHATDEKYNFENLQKHTVIQSQKLIHAQTLELTAANETILVDNLEVFRKNGFDFQINEDAVPTQRVKLVSMPVSRNWTFGKEDIEELIFMLTDSPGVMCRPTRVRQMFASRACRSSIMVGTALDKAEMKKKAISRLKGITTSIWWEKYHTMDFSRLLCHMGELDQPWNCPHGRPTIRHLINLHILPD